MIYVTGDTHSDFRRFSTSIFPEQKEMTKDDFVIILGDFGGIWHQEKDEKAIKKENYWLDWLEQKPFTTLFIDGNHENFSRLNSFPVKQWNGGKVHVIRPSVLHLMRGEVFKLQNKTFFAFGGASSHDISDGIIEYSDPDWKNKVKRLCNSGKFMYRINGLSWWPEELPSQEEMENAKNNLMKNNQTVDFVLSHTPPASIIALLGSGLYEQDVLTKFLEEVKQQVNYSYWLMGHMHINEQLNVEDLLLYEQIIRIV